MNDLLSTLRDIHLPEYPSWYPPAIGWWLLIIIVVGIVAAGVWIYSRYLAHIRSPQYLALNELEILQNKYHNHKDIKQLFIQLSALLRRVALSLYPRSQVASLSDAEWFEWLNQTVDEEIFSPEIAKTLSEATYRPTLDNTNPQEIIHACKTWIERVNKPQDSRRMDRHV